MLTTEYKDQSIGIIEILIEATHVYAQNFLTLISPFLILAIGTDIFLLLNQSANVNFRIMLRVILFIFDIWIYLGFIHCTIQAGRGESVSYRNLFILKFTSLMHALICFFIMTLSSLVIFSGIFTLDIIAQVIFDCQEKLNSTFAISTMLLLSLLPFLVFLMAPWSCLDTQNNAFKALIWAVKALKRHPRPYFALIIPICIVIGLDCIHSILLGISLPFLLLVTSIVYNKLLLDMMAHEEQKNRDKTIS